MDIEEYLKQKRGLERKKEVLEAKTKLSDVKDSFKKEKVKHEFKPERVEYRGEPGLKPWMIWDLMILTIVIILFSVSYFVPKYDESVIKSMIKDNLITGQTVASTTNTETQSQSSTDTQSNINSQQTTQGTNEPDELLPGPDFFLSVRDKVLGEFDENGKLDGEILVVVVENGYYKDAILTVKNGENEPIKCDVEKDSQIDTDFNGEYEGKDIGKLATIELDPGQKKDTKDTIPGDLESGNYVGQGRARVEYKSTCVFCLDDECETVENKGKSEKSIFFIVIINPSGSSNVSSGNNTNSLS